MVSAPPLPSSVSLPPSPISVLMPALPVTMLAMELPVPLMDAAPVRVRFSNSWPERLKETELKTLSVPWPVTSMTLSPILST
ncbi:hypothetical protein FJ546_27445 [Mesorhizobium sp. B2-4-19]|nr:hypothetical protein FJ546_27445 [Mesorhizobium sp. B2-4-19]